MKYFVILRHQNNRPLPLIDSEDDEWPALFETEKEAREAGERNLLGESFGFAVYEWVM